MGPIKEKRAVLDHVLKLELKIKRIMNEIQQQLFDLSRKVLELEERVNELDRGAAVTKRCQRCGARRALTTYRRDRRSPDGRVAYCTPCERLRGRIAYQRTRMVTSEEQAA